MNKGIFIVVDGISGSGKGRQMELIRASWPGCFFSHEPSGDLYGCVARSINERTPFSKGLLDACLAYGDSKKYDFWNKLHEIIRKIQKGSSPDELERQLLIMADRIYNLETKYLPNLAKGTPVVIDRYFPSLLAYGFSGGLDMDALWQWQKTAFDSSDIIGDKWMSDLMIVFDLSAEKAFERLKSSGKIIDVYEEKIERMKKIREGYWILSKRNDISKRIVVIDADRSPKEIFTDVKREIDKVL